MTGYGCASCGPSQAQSYPQGYMGAPEFRGMTRLGQLDLDNPGVRAALTVLAMGSAAASTYHGYKRNRGSVGWAVAWGLLGGIFPIITPAVAVAQGFGKPAK